MFLRSKAMSLLFGSVSVFAWGLGSDLCPFKLVQNTFFNLWYLTWGSHIGILNIQDNKKLGLSYDAKVLLVKFVCHTMLEHRAVSPEPALLQINMHKNFFFFIILYYSSPSFEEEDWLLTIWISSSYIITLVWMYETFNCCGFQSYRVTGSFMLDFKVSIAQSFAESRVRCGALKGCSDP